MTLALIIGLCLGVGGAVANDKLSGGFATPRQIEDMLQLPLLSSINVMEAKDLTVKGKAVRLPLYPAVSPLSRYAKRSGCCETASKWLTWIIRRRSSN